ncbi:hypothetical protein K505DRAFT_280727 [Melanomma pulvis-pyrius CBS 109.77]|uniref:Uncharacterized protein n=1 Tax=Melanomma pulvis-pyrius CBS 109.77 TaxID=1314802 RepID=A0A6A6X5C2_9PLEO|nr:hypothetical protein K505DRAFT_280727 [Melanomma pulvis-pyrius CBS 109.77]
MSFLNLDYLSVGSSSYFYNYPDFTPYANPPTNYLGTVLFLLYILLALVLTGYIPLSLFKRYQSLVNFPLISTTSPPSPRIRDARARHIKIYAGLASVSFAMLSYHMLNFLMDSYAHWSASKGSESEMNLETLKQWMLNSALFETFARELVDDGPSTVWMQVGVLGSWFWGVWMGGKANERSFSKNTMLPYILLSQILPTSFTVTLFLVHLHLASPDLAPAPPVSESPVSNSSISEDVSPEKQPLPLHQPHRKTSLLLPTILLNAVLLSLAPLRHHRLFTPLVLFTRLLLLLPYTGRISTREVEVDRCMMVSGGFLVGNLMVLKKGYGIGDIVGALGRGDFGGSAVKALAWDAGMGALVGRVVAWGGGV